MENLNNPLPTTQTEVLPTANYAGFWLRLTAATIDGFLSNIIFFSVSFLFAFIATKSGTLPDASVKIVSMVLSLIIWVLYFPFAESKSGATFGKKIVGIRVTKENNEQLTFLRSLGRNAAKVISGIILMLGFLLAAFTPKKQALHDMIAGCVVVKQKSVSLAKIWSLIILIFVASIGSIILAGHS